ncbi:probable protein phosphatase 2C 74 [Salvia splendens]|uniref:probable protein phosphatase 2C 74 n=1 Tax=Salvia splendens TaxID=180675 RepID=UPI001C251F47|nr:probable protein phosphatase 2C 74 [Salvia splendens]
MGSCLSCESRWTSSPTVAKKWKFSTITSFEQNNNEDKRLHRGHNYFSLNRPTEIASLFSQQGKKAMLALEKFGSTTKDSKNELNKFGSRTEYTTFYDGLGPQGHMVAKRIRDFLPLKLSEHWEVKILRKIGSNFETNPNCVCGTTSVTLVTKGKDLTIGNSEESRAVLGMRDANNAFVPVQLSVGEDEFVLLTTAGVWDKLLNEDVISTVANSPSRLCAARAVVNVVFDKWMRTYRLSKVDAIDCPVVCLFLNEPRQRNTRPHVCSRPEQFLERLWL